jgi:hypothetical protein
VAGVNGVEQPLGVECCDEGELDLGRGVLDRDDLGDHLRETRSAMINTAIPAAGKGRVVDPNRVRGVIDPVRERLAHRLARAWPWPKVLVSKDKYPAHRRR